MPENFFDILAQYRPLEPVERLWRHHLRINPRFRIPQLGPPREKTQLEELFDQWNAYEANRLNGVPNTHNENESKVVFISNEVIIYRIVETCS